METIAWIGFSQSLFASILMLAKRKVSIPDKILTAWLFLLAFEFLTCALDYVNFKVPLLSSSFLLFNPAFYLYTRSLVEPTFKLNQRQILHLLPFIFFELVAYSIKEPFSITNFFDANQNLWYRMAFSVASVFSWILYNWVTLNVILKHRKRLMNEYSTIESSKRLSWLFFIVIFYNLFCLASIAVAVSVIVVHLEFPLSPVYNYSALLLMSYILGFYGLRQGTIFMDTEIVETVKGKYVNSTLSEKRKKEIETLILEHFNKNMPYLNPELDMNMISGVLKIPKYQLTEVLNNCINKNFFSFVNEYRVKAVEEMLIKNKDFSIEDIGYECGFNSKSSFFTVFKKITGMTPMQFRQTIDNK
jgi:AraC-like DNA-binding protein